MSTDYVGLSWTQIFDDVDGSPVREAPAQFLELKTFYNDLADDAEAVSTQFDRLVLGHSVQFEGQAADAFIDLIGDVGTQLGYVPERVREVSTILGRHADDLIELRGRVSEALARANTCWNECESARLSVQSAERAERNLSTQLDELDETSDPDGSQRVIVGADADEASRSVGSARRRRDDADDALAATRREWTTLHDEYGALDRTTGWDLKQVRLGELQDPGWLDKLGSMIAGFGHMFYDAVVGIVENAIIAFEAALDQRWGDALFALSDMVGDMLFVLGTLLIFASGGTLAAVFFGLAVAKLTIDATLLATGTEGSDGRTMDWQTVALDGLTVVTAGWSARANAGNAFQFHRPFTSTVQSGQQVVAGVRTAGGVRTGVTNFMATNAPGGTTAVAVGAFQSPVVQESVTVAATAAGYARNTAQAYNYDFGPDATQVDASQVPGGRFTSLGPIAVIEEHLDCITNQPNGLATMTTAVLVEVED